MRLLSATDLLSGICAFRRNTWIQRAIFHSRSFSLSSAHWIKSISCIKSPQVNHVHPTPPPTHTHSYPSTRTLVQPHNSRRFQPSPLKEHSTVIKLSISHHLHLCVCMYVFIFCQETMLVYQRAANWEYSPKMYYVFTCFLQSLSLPLSLVITFQCVLLRSLIFYDLSLFLCILVLTYNFRLVVTCLP